MIEVPQPSRLQKLLITGDLPRLIVYICTAASVSIFSILGILSLLGVANLGNPMDFFVFALLSGTGIYGMYEYLHHRRIRKIDSIFPDFVRDLAAARRAGMTFTNAILFTSKGNYGLLTKEIQKIAQQISWGSSVEEALESFANRINTKAVRRTVSLIIEASKSGGNVADVLDVAAEDAREIKILEGERRVGMASYVIVIYVGMYVFLAIIAILSGVFIPTLTSGSSAGLASALGSRKLVSTEAITSVFYFATLVQAVGTGLVAGVFEDGHLESSVKHIFIMVFSGWLLFKLFLGV
ncbi:MAG TPA: type II secretion system F family protein [Thermoplasmatales archaeon]|nr:type II secretion system F family protein [Thermoplasmatales archaeon]